MGLQAIDFRGVVDLDRNIIDHLENYLKEKESRLSQQMMNLLPSSQEAEGSILPARNAAKLSEAVDSFARHVRGIIQRKIRNDDPNFSDRVLKQLNAYFWDYTESLEGCVTELFQQIKQINIDKWHLTLFDVVHHIQDLLMHRINDLILAIKRLAKPLKEFCEAYPVEGAPFWKKWFQSYLDPDLLKNLENSKKALQIQYQDFSERYQEFKRLSLEVDNSIEKMKKLSTLSLMDVSDQRLYIEVYKLLKLIENNPNSQGMLAEESVRSLKYLASLDSVWAVCRIYYRELKNSLFRSSLEYKSIFRENESLHYSESLKRLQNKVEDYQSEVQHLMHTIARYRTFALKNDPNPYVGTQLGFSERIVGPEPAGSIKLLNLAYSVEELNSHYKDLLEALQEDPEVRNHKERKAGQEIDKLLHEMGQPLISHNMMRNRAERLLQQLEISNELGSPNKSMIDHVEGVLSKSMRADWKYHALHGFASFHEMYRLHQGMSRRFEDPAHTYRSERFHLFFDQIEGWVKKGDQFIHIHEIEQDIHDMKTYLQDFLAAVQRATKDRSLDPFLDETIQKYRQQLLDYRYMFGQFFSTLMVNNTDGQQLRMQFLFVDQYFESIETLLHDLNKGWEEKQI